MSASLVKSLTQQQELMYVFLMTQLSMLVGCNIVTKPRSVQTSVEHSPGDLRLGDRDDSLRKGLLLHQPVLDCANWASETYCRTTTAKYPHMPKKHCPKMSHKGCSLLLPLNSV